ncbi:hypothetical protein HK405_012039 [Cladochytrium tenue]|nr:hypothetical protein HK405_012039 [Cladochytrium tenue]
MATRSQEKAAPVVSAIRAETGNNKVEFMQLDLLSLASVDQFSTAFLARGLPLHGLVLNAGVMNTPFTLSADGIEAQFATNHVGHFRLVTRLLERVVESAPSRIVVVAARLMEEAPKPMGIRFDKINDRKTYKPAMGFEVGQRVVRQRAIQAPRGKGVTNVYVNTLHPGVIRTELIRHQAAQLGFLAKPIIFIFFKFFPEVITEDQGASTSLYLATDPEVEKKDYRGQYFYPVAKLAEPGTPFATDAALARRLWEFTEKLVAEKVRN